MPSQAPNHKVIQSFDHVVLQGHVANKNHHISITRVSMATKLGRMIASLDGLLPIMSHDTLITWPCEIRGSFTGGGSVCKCLSRHRLLVYYLESENYKVLKFRVNNSLTLKYVPPFFKCRPPRNATLKTSKLNKCRGRLLEEIR